MYNFLVCFLKAEGRATTVIAVRDTELAKIPADVISFVKLRYPQVPILMWQLVPYLFAVLLLLSRCFYFSKTSCCCVLLMASEPC